MTKVFLGLFLFLIVIKAFPSGSDTYIPTSDDDTFYDLNFLYMKKDGKVRYLGEVLVREAYGNLDRIQSFIRAGANYRWSTNFKLAFSYKLQQGVRHDDSWVRKGSQWFWVEDEANPESVLLPEVTYRTMVSDKTRFDLRLRYSWNISENLRTIKTRPSFTYFKFKNGKAYMNY